MTDNDIIKAKEPEIVANALKTLEPFEVRDIIAQMQETITRQKAEIERLTAERNTMHKDVKAAEEYAWQLKTEKENLIRTFAESETIKEFAERLCEDRVSNDPVVIAVKTELKFMEGELK